LTTHYLEEAADCDEVAFLSAGRIVRQGNPRALTETLGAYIVEVETHRPQELAEQLAPRLGAALIEGERLRSAVTGARRSGGLAGRACGHCAGGALRRPNLNDVFLW